MPLREGVILLINGASSSGKTSLAHTLQDRLPEPYLEAGIDKFIFMLAERYLERPLWDDILGLADHAGAHGHALINGMHQAICALSRAGLPVIADHVLVEPAWLQECARLFSELPAYFIGVYCPLEVLEARERSRKNRTLGQALLQYPRVHAHGVYDLEVDTSQGTPEELATQFETCLNRGTPPQAFRLLREKFERENNHALPGPTEA